MNSDRWVGRKKGDDETRRVLLWQSGAGVGLGLVVELGDVDVDGV